MRAAGRIVAALSMLVGVLVLGVGPGNQLPSASAATVVSTTHCRRYDPNLVRGACLRYQARGRTAYTWIGSYRASNGHVFFCIDYLYDSRISGKPEILRSTYLLNQVGVRIGNPEVAALNYIVSTWAPNGSTGSNARDAAIALLIRELMSDGVRPDGTVVYPRGLKVGKAVQPPIGGLGGSIMSLARSMWAQASKYYGGFRLSMTSTTSGSTIRMGTTRTYLVVVRSAAGNAVPGVKVGLTCTGPVRCPGSVVSRSTPVAVRLTPTGTGQSTLTATATGPTANGRVYRVHNWHSHGGGTAQDRGIQRGWIAERNTTTAQAKVGVVIVKGTPTVATRASSQTAAPGAALYDVVTVSGLPDGYRQQVTAHLHGPFPTEPDQASCTEENVRGSVTFTVAGNGEFRTPTVTADQPGYYVWTESLPGDDRTNAVRTPCGLAEETTLVAPRAPTVRTPSVQTRASAQRALVGARISDTVVVSGLGSEDEVTVRWSLLGPLAPRAGSCAGLDWSRAGTLARGTFGATGNGTYRTAATLLRRPGCVTYAEDLPATSGTAAAHSVPGLPSETVVVTRPPTPFVPEIPSGPFSAGRPVRVLW